MNPDHTNPLRALIPEPPTGVWVVAFQSWIEGPGEAIPYLDELAALREANKGPERRAWFVPFGADLREVMDAGGRFAADLGGEATA